MTKLSKDNNMNTFRDMLDKLESVCNESQGRLFSKVVIDVRMQGNSIEVQLCDFESLGPYLNFDGDEYHVIDAVLSYLKEHE